MRYKLESLMHVPLEFISIFSSCVFRQVPGYAIPKHQWHYLVNTISSSP